jgi:hypothetical protein
MNISPLLWFPAGRFFVDGRIAVAVVLLFLQATLIFWPLAVSIARRQVARLSVERLLTQLADAHRPSGHADLPMKSFRKAA